MWLALCGVDSKPLYGAPLPFVSRSHQSKQYDSNAWSITNQKITNNRSILKESIATAIPRGGSQEEAATDSDDERYSRQVYTLGARAHGLVRSATIYIDGPATSGLVYECVKDLALSGVGNIVLWESSTDGNDEEEGDVDANYHDASLDDLGNAYVRAAKAEVELSTATGTAITSPEHLLEEYIRRLNPSVKVSKTQRPQPQQSFHAESGGVILCVDRPYETQVKLNTLARQNNMKFVSVETAGVYGRIFCDFGPDFEVFDSDGETPLVTPLDRIEIDEEEGSDSVLAVRCIDTEKHDVSKGDKLQFQKSDGDMMPEVCTVVKVLTPHRIKITCDDTNNNLQDFVKHVNENAASFSRIKVPAHVSFVPLEEAMSKANTGELFTPCDLEKSFDDVRRSSVVACFQALDTFVSIEKSLPTAADMESFQKAMAACSTSNDESTDTNKKEQTKHVKNFLQCCAAKLTPLQAMFGAVGAQEALKAVTGLYNPVQQMLLYDCDELLGKGTKKATGEETCSTGLAYIFGTKFEKKVKSSKLFVVGAGAIGCEVLKNLAALGFATSKKGCISVTDMDTIERSNLSRQLLFRDSDIGEFKSVAAKGAILRFNPAVNMDVHTSKVGDESRGPFDSDFWSSAVDVVMNALDNMEARLFMDHQCVSNKKALVDAGTLGSKGNVQVVVPHQSESYGSSMDPPEPAIPVCTLKNFPYAISHTIQWGRDLFDGLYNRRPRQANDLEPLLSSGAASEVAQTLLQTLGDDAALDAAGEVVEDISYAASEDLASARKGALQWAVNLATRLFHDVIADLLREHPVDELDEDGEAFWGGTRKVPTPLFYSSSIQEGDTTKLAANENLLEFVQSAARLRTEMLFRDQHDSLFSPEEVEQALLESQSSRDSESTTGKADEEVHQSTLSKLVEKLNIVPNIVPSGSKKNDLHPVEFEKDDESNGHVHFVTAASNLRAICYGIPPVNAMETRRVAGKIVPAMITTTAVVSALSCVELLKLLQKAPLSRHRNAFINLALPFFAFTIPVPADEVPGPDGKTYTVWDTIDINEKKKAAESKDLTLRRFIKQLKKAVSDDPEGIEVSTVSAGQYMVYASFLHEDDKDMLSRSIWDLVEEAASEELDEDFAGRNDESGAAQSCGGERANVDKLELTVTVEDTESGEEFELPPVYVHRAK